MAGQVLLPGLAIGGYRSFGGNDLQRIGPMTKVHLLAGPNNSGKSNVLKVAATALPALRKNEAFSLGDTDAPVDSAAEGRHFRIGVLLPLPDDKVDEVTDGTNLKRDEIRALFEGPTFSSESNDDVWIQFTVNDGRRPGWVVTPEQIADLGSQANESGRNQRLKRASNQLANRSSGDPTDNARHALGAIVSRLGLQEQIPRVAEIGAFRRITTAAPGSVNDDDFDGTGLIERLARLENPGFDEPHNRERFDRVNRFVQRLFDDPSAEIDVPHDRKTLLIRYEDQWLPLASILGTR